MNYILLKKNSCISSHIRTTFTINLESINSTHEYSWQRPIANLVKGQRVLIKNSFILISKDINLQSEHTQPLYYHRHVARELCSLYICQKRKFRWRITDLPDCQLITASLRNPWLFLGILTNEWDIKGISYFTLLSRDSWCNGLIHWLRNTVKTDQTHNTIATKIYKWFPAVGTIPASRNC